MLHLRIRRSWKPERGPEGNVTYEYDANVNLTKKSGSRTASYTYDWEKRLTKANTVMPCFPKALLTQIASRSELSCDWLHVQQGNSVTAESYIYDYEGNRTSKTVDEGGTTYYVNDTEPYNFDAIIIKMYLQNFYCAMDEDFQKLVQHQWKKADDKAIVYYIVSWKYDYDKVDVGKEEAWLVKSIEEYPCFCIHL